MKVKYFILMITLVSTLDYIVSSKVFASNPNLEFVFRNRRGKVTTEMIRPRLTDTIKFELRNNKGLPSKINPMAQRIASWPAIDSHSFKQTLNTAQSIGLNKTVVNHPIMVINQSIPVDVMGAIGPKQFIVCTNDGIRSFDRNLNFDGVLDVSLESFFDNSNAAVGDPTIIFDKFSQRWFITATEFFSFLDFIYVIPNHLFIAVSDGPVITKCTKWNKYKILHSDIPGKNGQPGDIGLDLDFPRSATDQYNLYIGANMFTVSDYVSNTAYVFKKEALIKGENYKAVAFRGLNPASQGQTEATIPRGVQNFDANPEFGYFLGINIATAGELELYKVINPASDSPDLSGPISVTIPVGSDPIPAPSKGNVFGQFGLLDTIDQRILTAHIINGSMFAVNTTSVNQQGVAGAGNEDRTAARFYEVNPNTATLVQAGTLFDNAPVNPRFYYIPSLMTNRKGELTIIASVSSTAEYINVATTGRLATDPLGTLRPPVLLTNSNAAYNLAPFTAFFGGQRWGDYSNTSLDPLDETTIWSAGEFAFYNDAYGIQVTQHLSQQ